MSLRTDVLYSLKWLAAGRFLGQMVAWAITLFVIRILEPTDYGLMAIAEIFIGFAALFREMGLYSAMVQSRDLKQRHIEQAFGILIVINTGLYLLMFVTAPVFADFFDDARLVGIIRVLGLQFPLVSIGVVQSAMLSRSMKFKHVSLVNFVVTLGNGFTTLGFALSGAGVWALVYGSLAGSLIRSIGLVVAARHWCRPRFSREGMADMLRFGSFVTISRMLWYIYNQADVFIIGKVLGNEILGFYSIGRQLASLPMKKVAAMLNQVGLAAYSSIQQDMHAVRSHYLKVIRILSFLSFPVFWGISCISPDFVPIVLGDRWGQAIIPLQLLSLIMPIRMIGHSGSPLTAIGKPHIGTLNHFITFIIMPPAFFIGAWFWGLVGVSMVWVVAYPIVMLCRLYFSLPALGLGYRDYFRALAGPATGGAAMYIAVIITREGIVRPLLAPVPGLLLLISVGAVTYLLFMWLLRQADCREVLALAKG